MKGVVTGGTGFLGSHVADVLAERGHDISVVDVIEGQRHRTIRADLNDSAALAKALRGVEFICHLAAVGDVYLAAERPALAANVNVTGSANLCDAALQADVRSIVCASTWEVYGEPAYQPMDERHPCAPQHPYNITKLAGERLSLAYGHMRKGLSVTALRLGTAYGTRMRPNSVFSIFMARAMRGEPITIQGSGNQGRQFTHARDIGSAFALAVERGSNGSVYNIVADEMISIRQLALLVAEALPTRVEFGPPRAGEVPSAIVSSAKAEAELGWRPETRFRDGLFEMIKSYRVPV